MLKMTAIEAVELIYLYFIICSSAYRLTDGDAKRYCKQRLSRARLIYYLNSSFARRQAFMDLKVANCKFPSPRPCFSMH